MIRARVLIFALIAAGAALAAIGAASAQTFPSRPIKIVVPYPPGGPTDVLSRLVADRMGPVIGGPIIVESRPGGAGGSVGAKYVASADPDGYTLLISQVGALTISPSIYKDAEHEWTRLLAPVALVAVSPQLLVVHPSVPVKSVAELIAYAKANPGKLNYSSPGVGAVFHMSGELFKLGAGVDIVHVPYKGASPALQAVIAGEVAIGFNSLASVLPHLRSGKLKVLAVLEAKRYPGLPDVPSIGEALPGFEKPASWFGLFGPAGLPAATTARLHDELVASLRDPDVRSKIDELAMTVIANTPEQFSAMLKSGIDQYGRLIKAAGIQPE